MCLDTKLSQGEAALYMGTNLWAGKARRFTGLQQVLGTDLEGRARRPLGLRPCNVHFVKDILVFSILTQPVTCTTKSHFGDLKRILYPICEELHTTWVRRPCLACIMTKFKLEASRDP